MTIDEESGKNSWHPLCILWDFPLPWRHIFRSNLFEIQVGYFIGVKNYIFFTESRYVTHCLPDKSWDISIFIQRQYFEKSFVISSTVRRHGDSKVSDVPFVEYFSWERHANVTFYTSKSVKLKRGPHAGLKS